MKGLFNVVIAAALVGMPMLVPSAAMAQGGQSADPLFSMLSASQKAKVEGILNASKKKNQPLFNKIKAFADSHKNQKTLSAKDQATWTALMNQFKAEQAANRQKVLAILTPEQKAKLQEAAKKQSEQANSGM